MTLTVCVVAFCIVGSVLYVVLYVACCMLCVACYVLSVVRFLFVLCALAALECVDV